MESAKPIENPMAQPVNVRYVRVLCGERANESTLAGCLTANGGAMTEFTGKMSERIGVMTGIVTDTCIIIVNARLNLTDLTLANISRKG
jgi:hypothetical protein